MLLPKAKTAYIAYFFFDELVYQGPGLLIPGKILQALGAIVRHHRIRSEREPVSFAKHPVVQFHVFSWPEILLEPANGKKGLPPVHDIAGGVVVDHFQAACRLVPHIVGNESNLLHGAEYLFFKSGCVLWNCLAAAAGCYLGVIVEYAG